MTLMLTRVEFWQAQLERGVDLIGTDDLAGLAAFLKESTTGVEH